MTREINGLIVMVVSDDGTRCAAECPHVVRAVGQGDCDECAAFTDILSFNNGANVRLPACIAAEQAAASAELALLLRAESEWIEQEAKRSAYLQGIEQAAASVPSCDDHLDGGARALDASEARQRVCTDCGRPATCIGCYEGAPEDAYACDVCCDHGNEGGRCRPVEPEWDASEALREARVQGMREAMEIVLFYTCGASSKGSRAIEAAIEAVRKGER